MPSSVAGPVDFRAFFTLASWALSEKVYLRRGLSWERDIAFGRLCAFSWASRRARLIGEIDITVEDPQGELLLLRLEKVFGCASFEDGRLDGLLGLLDEPDGLLPGCDGFLNLLPNRVLGVAYSIGNWNP